MSTPSSGAAAAAAAVPPPSSGDGGHTAVLADRMSHLEQRMTHLTQLIERALHVHAANTVVGGGVSTTMPHDVMQPQSGHIGGERRTSGASQHHLAAAHATAAHAHAHAGAATDAPVTLIPAAAASISVLAAVAAAPAAVTVVDTTALPFANLPASIRTNSRDSHGIRGSRGGGHAGGSGGSSGAPSPRQAKSVSISSDDDDVITVPSVNLKAAIAAARHKQQTNMPAPALAPVAAAAPAVAPATPAPAAAPSGGSGSAPVTPVLAMTAAAAAAAVPFPPGRTDSPDLPHNTAAAAAGPVGSPVGPLSITTTAPNGVVRAASIPPVLALAIGAGASRGGWGGGTLGGPAGNVIGAGALAIPPSPRGGGGQLQLGVPYTPRRKHSVAESLRRKHFLAVFRSTVIAAAKKQELARALPSPSDPEYFFRLNWVTALQSNGGMMAPDTVAQMGKVVHLVDIRFANDLIEPLGYIPGVDWVPKHQLDLVPKELPLNACVVLISADDTDARVAAKTLNELGMPFVCAMKGGMKDWRFMGFQTSRDRTILKRQGVLRKSDKEKERRRIAAAAALLDSKPVFFVSAAIAQENSAKRAAAAADGKTTEDMATAADLATAAAAAAAAQAVGGEAAAGDSGAAAAAGAGAGAAGTIESKSQLVTLPEIKQHIGDPLNIQWLKLAAFLLHARQSCVDGRDDSGVIGTPGGDMGEFVLSLTVLEQLSGKELSLGDVSRLFRRRLEAFGRCYMHTDVHALERLQAAFRADPRLSPVMTPIMKSALEYRSFMRCPPEQYRPAIMEHQLDSNHFGCGHMRLLLQKSKEYKVRHQLVRDCLHCFFTARWNGAIECEYMALSGHHNEGAVVTVWLDTKVASFTTIPLISPSCDGKQIFVNHPQVSSFLRQQHGLFYTGQSDIVSLSEAARDEYVARVEALASLHASKTLGYLASGLPCYTCKFQKPGEPDAVTGEVDHPFTVAASGVIGD